MGFWPVGANKTSSILPSSNFYLNIRRKLSIIRAINNYFPSGSKGGDNESNIQFLVVLDFGYWLKGNVQELSSF